MKYRIKDYMLFVGAFMVGWFGTSIGELIGGLKGGIYALCLIIGLELWWYGLR